MRALLASYLLLMHFAPSVFTVFAAVVAYPIVPGAVGRARSEHSASNCIIGSLRCRGGVGHGLG